MPTIECVTETTEQTVNCGPGCCSPVSDYDA